MKNGSKTDTQTLNSEAKENTERPTVKLWFSDFWPGPVEENFFYRLISKKYKIELDSDRPDFLIYSCMGNDYLKYTCPRIFFTGEPRSPKYRECDYALSFDHFQNNGRNYRLPLFRLYPEYQSLTQTREANTGPLSERKFCSFVASNARAKTRIEFFDLLSKYRQVDSGGKVRNNVGGRVPDKVAFIEQYKFNIAFENRSCPGYATEKLVEALAANTVPIYWGDPLIDKELNTKAFINCHEFDSWEQVVEHVIKVDSDDALYQSYLTQPYFRNGREPDYLKEQSILNFFDQIFSSKYHPLTRTGKRIRHSLRRATERYKRLLPSEFRNALRKARKMQNPEKSRHRLPRVK